MNSIEAIYEHGIFRPLTKPELINGQYVRIVVETPESEQADEILELASQVYEGLSDDDINEIELIALNRGSFPTYCFVNSVLPL